MGKAGRFACIFVPMILTIASLVFQIMVGLGGTNSSNSYLSNIYFLQANTTSAAHNSSLNHFPATDKTDPADKSANGSIILSNFYTVHLWNYCAGNGANTTANVLTVNQNSSLAVDHCTGRQLNFWFDPSAVWGFNVSAPNLTVDNLTVANPATKDLRDWLNYYQQTSSKWISTLFIIAVVSTAIEILVGIGGLFSRLGSIFTTISALITTIFIGAFAVLATANYYALAAAFNLSLKPYGITFYTGPTIFIYIWLAVVCSLVSVLFWAFSSCCCSGRSSRHDHGGKPTVVERTPYTYERVDGPYGSTSQVPLTGHQAPLNTVGGRPTAYEPFRHAN